MRKRIDQLSQNKFHSKNFGNSNSVLDDEKPFVSVYLQVFRNPGWEMAFPFTYVARLTFSESKFRSR